MELSSCFLKGSLPPKAFLRVWSEPGLHISSFLPRNSLQKSSCCSSAREDLASNLSLPDSQSSPCFYFSTRILLFPFVRGRLCSSERSWWTPMGWLSSSPFLREGHSWGVLASCRVGTEAGGAEGTAHGFLLVQLLL